MSPHRQNKPRRSGRTKRDGGNERLKQRRHFSTGRAAHRSSRAKHSKQRAMQRYYFVTAGNYDWLCSEILHKIKEALAGPSSSCIQMWPSAWAVRMDSVASYLEDKVVFVGYDDGAMEITTWFPTYDPRIQAWVLEHWGADAVRKLLADARQSDGLEDD